MENTPTTAEGIGAGLAVSDEGEVVVVVLLSTEEEQLAVIGLPPEVAMAFVSKVADLIQEAEQAQEAVRTMGLDAARDYIKTWTKRNIADMN